MNDFDVVLKKIKEGGEPDASELLDYLCVETKEQRCDVNTRLAEACFESGNSKNLEHAKVFMQRAWMLSGFSGTILPSYVKILSQSGDVESIRNAYKRLGILRAANGDISEAIRYFDLWQYAYPVFNHGDKYEYDFDILNSVANMARPYRFFSILDKCGVVSGGRIRVAYLLKGICEFNSVLMKMTYEFARCHDKSRFDIAFFAPEFEKDILNAPQGNDHIKTLEGHGCKVVLTPTMGYHEKGLFAAANLIRAYSPHILVTVGGLADFSHYFITCLRPAPVTIALVYGPPPQFVSPEFHWAITSTRHLQMECPVGCSLVPLQYDLPRKSQIKAYGRHELALPEDGTLLITAGRPQKFQSAAYWKAIVQCLVDHPQTSYIAVGVKEEEVSFSNEFIPRGIRPRIRFIGWTDDYLNILTMADIVIDTFPSGGGIVLTDAMALGMPVISFEQNYLKLFDQADWSLGSEIVDIPEMIVPGGDFESFRRIVSALIMDKAYRRQIGEKCSKQVRNFRGNPARMVRRYEEVFERVLQQAGTHLAVSFERTSRHITSGPDNFTSLPPAPSPEDIVAVAHHLCEKEATLAEEAARLHRCEADLRDAQIAHRDAQIVEKNDQIAHRDAQIKEILGSLSWQVTAPFRKLMKLVTPIKDCTEMKD